MMRILKLTVITIVIATGIAFTAACMWKPEGAGRYWACYQPVITIWAASHPRVDGGVVYDGSIISGEIRKTGAYRQVGLLHRWDFELVGKNYNAAFIISPDGLGRYYDFSSNDKDKPQFITHCSTTAAHVH